MNDIPYTPPLKDQATSPAKKEDVSKAPPTAEEFERVADAMSRDLRSIHRNEITQTAKAHYSSAAPDGNQEAHDRKGSELLDDLSKTHNREQFTFRSCIGKLRSHYAKEHGHEFANGHSKDQARTSHPGRDM